MAELENYWTGKRIIVTGGEGFLGRRLCPLLNMTGAEVFVIPREKDLTEPMLCDAIFMHNGFGYYDLCVHLAARTGGIGYNSTHPAETYYINTMLNTNVVRSCVRAGVRKIVALGSTCMYPKDISPPFTPEDLFSGKLEFTNHPYGLSKLSLLTYIESACVQYGLHYLFLIFCNFYGPSRNENFEQSHVIPALVQKCLDVKYGKSDKIVVWGTGLPTREFIHIGDVARAIMASIVKPDHGGIYNVGSGEVISIDALLHMIMGLTECQGTTVEYDSSRPDGQFSRLLDSSQFRKDFDWHPLISLKDGLADMISSMEK